MLAFVHMQMITPLKAEVIAIGTEVLMGEVINTNASWLSHRLIELGIDVLYHTTVGDNPVRVDTILKQAANRADVLMLTGGLGPTEDDLTIELVARAFGAGLTSDPDSEKAIAAFFERRGQQAAPSNLKQAKKPEGACTVANPVGTAPGIVWRFDYEGKPRWVIALPGVPRELMAMWAEVERLLANTDAIAGNGATRNRVYKKFMHFCRIGESALMAKLSEAGLNNLLETEVGKQNRAPVTVAPYVSAGEVRLRLAVRADSQSEADALLSPIETAIMQAAGDYCYAFSTDETGPSLEEAIGKLLMAREQTVAVAESCTGGLVSDRLTNVSGSAAYIHLNLVTYHNDAKTAELGVPADVIEQEGAVSQAVARAMAEGIRKKAGADYGLSLTGIAGPTGGSEEKPIGLVWIGLATPDGTQTQRVQVTPTLTRKEIKYLFSQHALGWLESVLRAKK